jgi:S1-C subfamily serine protease
MRSFATAIIAILLLTVPTFAGYSTVARSVRALQAPRTDENGITVIRNICTVTSINSDLHYWLTAAHCVGAPELFIAGRHADVVFSDTKADLAVLYTAGYSLPSLKMRTTRPAVGQFIMMVGHPVGLPQVQLFSGQVSSLRTLVDAEWFMMFDMTACGGNSGSAVVDSNDQVVSVLQIGFGQGCSAFTGGAPWDVLARLVGKYFKQ